MATGTVRLMDAITPDVYFNYLTLDTTARAKLMGSGIVRSDPVMAQKLAGAGIAFQTPFWGDLDDDGSSIGSDDPARVITPSKIRADKHQFVRQVRTKSWSSADLVRELVGSDPMKRIASLTGKWWGREFDVIGYATIEGFLADNVANDSADMVHDVTAAAGNHTVAGNTVANNVMSARVILDAKQQMGELAYETLSKIMMHSQVYTNLEKQNMITFVPSSDGRTRFPFYLGFAVIISDRMPVQIVEGNPVYTSYLSGPDILGFGEHAVEIPVEVKREPGQGNGMGVETLYTRRQFALSPYWFTFTQNTVSDEFPTTADLRLAVNWDRKATERKHIPFVAIKTLG